MIPVGLTEDRLAALVGASIVTQFPGLREDAVRLDGPGGTLVHAAVGEAMSRYLSGPDVANDHGSFAPSQRSDAIVAWARGRIRALLRAEAGLVVFGPNMTTLTTMFARAVADGIQPGDEIVCTELDHEANVAPWLDLARRRGARVRLARMESATLPAASVEQVLTERTRWVAVTAASNALGVMPDLPAISAAARRVGARMYVDGVQAIAHRPVDVDVLGADAFVTSAYKWYGPHCAALWIRPGAGGPLELGEQVPSAGGELPDRLELGTTNFEAVLGTGVAAEVLLRWDRAEIAEREGKLVDGLLAHLHEHPRIRVLGPAPDTDHVPVVTFQVAGLPAATVAGRLADAGICVWDGTFYASGAMRAVAPENPEAVRVGIACYTTEAQLSALADTLREVCT